ncbi:RING finger protein 37 [Pseudorasbora parva]|uniref:RING finger protein 37 n=1 Tax=Pseudorasbora parva TaxID=51549 RepID=UPI00351EF07A
MVLNLCLPHFQTSIQCNKLCADGYDVSNLLSEDPLARRRGFKLEYFLRPPVLVTLSFRLRVELCRLDVELWPWGMDQGRRSRRIEILACSEHDGPFQLVSRCDLQEELQICFQHPAFRPQDPRFSEPPPSPPPGAKMENLWRSLKSVTQLRIGIPYSGAACALGIKSLSVWASPSPGCPASEREKIWEAHLNSLTKTTHSTDAPPKADPVITSEIPEEFLDPLTQELMVFPMILPSGMNIDNSTLEEYQKREATWGRLPNDPFTGVPFSRSSKPLPNPLLKTRIDRLALHSGCTGVGSRNNLLNKPQPSRLASAEESGRKCGPYGLQTQTRSAKRKHESSFPSTSSNPVRKTPQTPSEPDSHERRLAESLDQALNAALHGLPVFTSPSESTSCVDPSDGQHRCVFCECVLSAYSPSLPSYALPCAHLTCGPCLRQKGPVLEISCPTCGSSAAGCDVTRVHH